MFMKKKYLILTVILLLISFVLYYFLIEPFIRKIAKDTISPIKILLASVYTAQKEYHKIHGTYAGNINELGIDVKQNDYTVGYYKDFESKIAKYCMTCTPGKDSYKLMAVKQCGDGFEIWTIDQNKNLDSAKLCE